jgi:3-oxoacyl-[acyl-carrier-protein] synthase II
MGVVSPIGCSVGEFQNNLLAGVSGVGPISLFDPAALPTRIAGEVNESLTEASFRDRKIAFAVDAAKQAMADASRCGTSPGLDTMGSEAGLSLGVGLELFSLDDMVEYRTPGFKLPESLKDRLTFLQTPSDLCLHMLSHRFGLHQAPLAHVSACAAGTDAIGAAFRLVASGRRRWMLAGGTDSMINPLGVGGFCRIGAMTRANHIPQKASRPFDRKRDGFVLGEGAAILVLERLEDAKERGAPTYAEVLGYGNSFDAHAISEPHPDGRGALQAMSRALEEARLPPERLDCINAHGTSTPKNDAVETTAIKRLLGDRAWDVPVYATKSMTGHLICAAGAIESVAAIACMSVGRLHPTINLEDPDPACDLDYVPNHARVYPHEVVLSNSFGFGGQNASIVFGRIDRA